MKLDSTAVDLCGILTLDIVDCPPMCVCVCVLPGAECVFSREWSHGVGRRVIELLFHLLDILHCVGFWGGMTTWSTVPGTVHCVIRLSICDSTWHKMNKRFPFTELV